MGSSRKSACAVFIAIGAVFGTAASAQVAGTWVGAGAGTWTTATNWTSSPRVPGDLGTAVFASTSPTGSFSISVPTSITLQRLTFDGTKAWIVSRIATDAVTPLVVEGVHGWIGTPELLDLSSVTSSVTVDGPGSVVKVGAGAVRISATSTFTGSITAREGLTIGGSSRANPMILDGGLFQPTTLVGRLHVGAAGGTIVFQSGGTPSIGTLSGAGALRMMAFATLSGNRNLPTSTTTWTLGNSSPDAYRAFSGTFDYQAGTLAFRNGAILDQAQLLSVTGGSLLLSHAEAVVNPGIVNRFNSVPITINGGTLAVDAGTWASGVTEHLGTVNLSSASVLKIDRVSDAIDAPRLTIDHLDRASRGHLLLVNSGNGSQGGVYFQGGTASLIGGGAPGTPQTSIIPWGRGHLGAGTASPEFLTYDANGLRPLTSSEYATSFTDATASANLKLGASAAMAAETTINSLYLSGATTNLKGSGTLHIKSGAMFLANGNGSSTSFSMGYIEVPIDFGDAEGVLHTTEVARLMEPVSGTNGVTIAGPGTVYLTGVSSFTGPVTVNEGTLSIFGNAHPGISGPLGKSNDAIILAPGSTGVLLNISGDVSRDIVVRRGSVPATIQTLDYPTEQFPGGRAVVVSSKIHLEPGAALRAYYCDFTSASTISGDGWINASNVVLSGNNSFTGGVVGTQLSIGSDKALGTGTLWLHATTSGTLSASGGSRTLANAFSVTSSPTKLAQTVINIRSTGFGLTFTGDANLGKNTVLSVPVDSPLAFLGETQSCTLSLYGSLTVRKLTATGVTINGGTLTLAPRSGGSLSTSHLWSLNLSSFPNAQSYLNISDQAMVIDNILGTAGAHYAIRDGAILSSLANKTTRGIGYGSAEDLGLSSFEGIVLAPAAVIFRYTAYGDINLDGRVDLTDATIFAANFNPHTAAYNKYWPSGNFDFDAYVGTSDLYLMARNWGTGVPLSENLPPAPVALASLGLPAAPEPGLALPALSGLIGCTLLRRARNVLLER